MLTSPPALNGGCVAAIIHLAAVTHLATDPALVTQNQPDVLKLHVEFLRPCERCESVIKITPLRIGTLASTLQLQLSQNGKLKVFALATSTNFDRPVGPTASTAWALLPPPKPLPDFDCIAAKRPEPNWLPALLAGEITPLTGRMLSLYARGGHKVDGICDAWNSFQGGAELMDATYLTMLTDLIPSMSDTLMRNNALYDAHAHFEKIEAWGEQHPGEAAVLTNTLAEAMQSTVMNHTLSLDVEFKKRLPKEGLPWIFTRTATKVLQDGRMDVDVTMCDQEMELLCQARHLILVLEAQRKFREDRKKSSL